MQLDVPQKRPRTEKCLFECCHKSAMQMDTEVEGQQRKNGSESNACTKQPQNQADACEETAAPRKTKFPNPKMLLWQSQNNDLVKSYGSALSRGHARGKHKMLGTPAHPPHKTLRRRGSYNSTLAQIEILA